LQVFYSIRSERQLMEQLDYNFRWFVGLSPDDPIWDPTVFTQTGNAFNKAMCSRRSWPSFSNTRR
jgi:transposase